MFNAPQRRGYSVIPRVQPRPEEPGPCWGDLITFSWNFDTSIGYTFDDTEIEDWATAGGALSFNNGTNRKTRDELDDNDFSNWRDSSNLSQDLVTYRYGYSAALASSAAQDFAELVLAGGAWNVAADGIYFYDDGGTSAQYKTIFWTKDRPRAPYSIFVGVGVRNDVSSTNYAIWDPSVPGWIDSNITRSTGWHSFKFRVATLIGPGGEPVTPIDAYLDLSKVLDLNDGGTRPRGLVVRTTQSTNTWRLDRIWHVVAGLLYYSSGTIITPAQQPFKVCQWRTWVDDSWTNSNLYKGSISHEVQYSTDGGANWGVNAPTYNDGLYENLTDANLQAAVVDGDSQDAIRVKSTLSASTFSLFSPLLKQVSITYRGEA